MNLLKMEYTCSLIKEVFNSPLSIAYFEAYLLSIAHFEAEKLNTKEISSYSLGFQCIFSCFSFTASD
jgi:hypothetical protein